MTRTLAASLAVVATATLACAPTQEPFDQGPPPGDVTISGAGGATGIGMCGNSSGSRSVPQTGAAGSGFGITPRVGATRSSAEAPPAISGGTLRVLADGHTVVAADPDRDRVYVVDLTTRQVKYTVMLQKGDEPGRVTADAAGNVHVALRHGGALVSIDPSTGTIVSRRSVCAAPRGVGYDAVTDLLHVACADGLLVSLKASGGEAVRKVQLEGDLRDVVVDGGRLRVSRFKSAELLMVEADGAMSKRINLPGFKAASVRGGDLFSAGVAWRTVEAPSGGVAMLHQRGFGPPVQAVPGGYGGFNQCDAIVQTAVSTVGPNGEVKTGPAMAGLVMAVDMALSADGNRVAIVSAGNATNSEVEGGEPRMPRLFVTDMNSATDQMVGCASDGVHGPCLPLPGFFPGGFAGTGGSTSDPTSPDVMTGSAGATGAEEPSPAVTFPTTCNMFGGQQQVDPGVPQVVGEPIAVAFAGDQVVVQSREPAVLSVRGGQPITLSTESRADTGHALFHANSGGQIACASCHPEGSDDGRVWDFACQGPRRTQSLQVGLKGTEPFHWGGDEKDFSALVRDVFVGRMSGPELRIDQVDATLHWIDAQPRVPHSTAGDPAAILRGRALFNDPARAACATCHSGSLFTNNQTVDVGTGGKFQVPSLVGIGTRGPFMHNGCAETLRDRFGACGGGDKHGVTSKLKPAELDDMLAYLNTL
jgi:hypothetical protein